jgi:intracellular sulfur oxidation DsrE/DsrF family protein
MEHGNQSRRALMIGAGSLMAAAALGTHTAEAQSGAFQPAAHSEDGWMNQRPGKHRIFIDAATPSGAGEAVLYSNNLYNANKATYAGSSDADLAIVVCLRHFATPFAFTDAMWAKYGKVLSAMVNFTDPKTKQAPAINLYRNSPEFALALPNLGNTIDAVTKRGAYFAVCDTATHFLAAQMASPMSLTADAIYKDLSTNLIPNSRLVAAGVMAVTRAQELGYSLLYAG